MSLTAEQFKEYTEALAENAILHKKVERLSRELSSRKREIEKLRELIDDIRWGDS